MFKLRTLAAGLIVALVAVYAASPLFAVGQIVQALDAKDSAKLAPYIDFPAVREDLGRQVEARIRRESAVSDGADAFSGLAGSLARALAAPFLDALITPDGLQAMLRGDEASPADATPKLDPETRTPVSAKDEKLKTSMRYTGLDSFVVAVHPRGSAPDAEPVLVRLQRRNLLQWIVTGIDLPKDFEPS